MLERLKSALVDSYVGAIALGWIFSEGLIHFAYVFVAPLIQWLQRTQLRGLQGMPVDIGFTLRDSIPDLARSIVLLLAGYGLLRWLYFKPVDGEVAEEADSLEEA